MGTTYTLKLHLPDETSVNTSILSTEIDKRLEAINAQMSTYIDTSVLSLINQSRKQEWIEIPADLYTVIKEALRVHEVSRGAFDITIGPLVNLWGFGPQPRERAIPDDWEINKHFAYVGSQYLHLRVAPFSLKKDHPNVYIDLSAIAKGYAVDAIAHHLDKRGFNNYIFEIGGEIKAKGLNTNHISWRIGIEKPLNDRHAVQNIIALKNTGMATSGDYRNYFEHTGKRYSHTINPLTGKPISHGLSSVTVLHSSTMTADAMATALLVLGPEKGLKLAKEEKLAALFIIREHGRFRQNMTKQFKQYLVVR